MKINTIGGVLRKIDTKNEEDSLKNSLLEVFIIPMTTPKIVANIIVQIDSFIVVKSPFDKILKLNLPFSY
jgi:hypothetical protein